MEAKVYIPAGTDALGFALPPPPPPPDNTFAGWTADYAFIPLHEMEEIMANVNDENATDVDQSVVKFADNNMTRHSAEWQLWQELLNYSTTVDTDAIYSAPILTYSIFGSDEILEQHTPTERLNSAPQVRAHIPR